MCKSTFPCGKLSLLSFISPDAQGYLGVFIGSANLMVPKSTRVFDCIYIVAHACFVFFFHSPYEGTGKSRIFFQIDPPDYHSKSNTRKIRVSITIEYYLLPFDNEYGRKALFKNHGDWFILLLPYTCQGK